MSKHCSAPADWKQTSISVLGGGLADVVQTGPFGAQLHSEDYVKEGIPFILIRNLRNGWVDESDMPRISEEDAKRLSMYALQTGDVIFTRVGRVGSCFLAEARHSGWIISGQMLRIRLPESRINHRYLIHALNSYPAQKRIGDASVGTTRQSINTKILSSLELLVPSPPEQRRIAAVLDTVDAAIAKTEAVIAKLKKVRAGLLHDLLTRGLDENGQLRNPIAHPEQFQDSPLGRIPRDWEVKELKDCYAVPSRNGLYKKATYYGSGHRMVHMPQMFKGLTVDISEAARVEVEPHELKRYALEEGDLLFARRSLNLEGAGLCSLVPALKATTTFESSIIRVRLDKTKILPKFAAEFLRSDFGYLLRRRFIRQVAVSGVSSEDVGCFLIPRPILDEQQQTLTRLEAHDRVISTYESELTKTVGLESGLMNDLLTGRVRVPPGIAVAG